MDYLTLTQKVFIYVNDITWHTASSIAEKWRTALLDDFEGTLASIVPKNKLRMEG